MTALGSLSKIGDLSIELTSSIFSVLFSRVPRESVQLNILYCHHLCLCRGRLRRKWSPSIHARGSYQRKRGLCRRSLPSLFTQRTSGCSRIDATFRPRTEGCSPPPHRRSLDNSCSATINRFVARDATHVLCERAKILCTH